MSVNLGPDSVLQRSNNLASSGIVLGISRKNKHHIQRQADRIALNLNVALLHDIEQPYLDLSRKIGQFVDREDPAIRTRKKSVMNRELVGKQVSAPRGFDRVKIA